MVRSINNKYMRRLYNKEGLPTKLINSIKRFTFCDVKTIEKTKAFGIKQLLLFQVRFWRQPCTACPIEFLI